jgi:hypothetical protein
VRRGLRILRCAVVFVVIGAAINVAVAWGCALWSPAGDSVAWAYTDGDRCGLDRAMVRTWHVAEDDPPHWLTLRVQILGGFGVRVCDVLESYRPHPGEPEGRGRNFVLVLQTGWPWAALACDRSIAPPRGLLGVPVYPPPPPPPVVWRRGLEVPAFMRPVDMINERGRHERMNELARDVLLPKIDTPRPLPLQPIARGVVVGTAFYGVLVGAIFGLGHRVRRAVRRRRFCCPACGYSLAGLTGGVCPECGAASVAAAHPHGLPALGDCHGAARSSRGTPVPVRRV